MELLKATLESGRLTNGHLVRHLEERAATHLGVEHCVADSSCTTGPMLVVQALDPSLVIPPAQFEGFIEALDRINLHAEELGSSIVPA